jgi:hypothetical protein
LSCICCLKISISGKPDVWVSKCLIVISGYGKSGKYLTTKSSDFSFPFSLSCKIAVDVNTFETEAKENPELSLLGVLVLKFEYPNDF